MISWVQATHHGGHVKGLLTVQPGPAPVALVQDVGGGHGHALGLPHLVRVQLAMRAQEEGVVHLLGGRGVVQPLLQPLQGNKLVGLAYEVGGDVSLLSTATQRRFPQQGIKSPSTRAKTIFSPRNISVKMDSLRKRIEL